MPPDPFSDIRAPSLRLIRGGADAPRQPVQDEHVSRGDDAAEPVQLLRSDARLEAVEPDTTAEAEVEAAEPDRETADIVAKVPDPRASGSTPVAETPGAARPLPNVAAAGLAKDRPSSAMTEMRRAVALGLVLAAAIVALALILQPAPAETSGMPAGSVAPAALGSGPLPDPDLAAATPSTLPAEISVRLRMGSDARAGEGEALTDAALAAGYQKVSLQEMPIPVSRSRIEYFSDADRNAAEALARTLAPVAGEMIELRDLSDVAGSAEPGRIEAWIGAAP